jgi:poly-gamma-glutamate synthesis protein (capsule biosynthesis protein)
LEILKKAGVKKAGAGENLQQASVPAVFEKYGMPKVFLFSYGVESSGIPAKWEATNKTPGINFLEDLSEKTLQDIKENIQRSASKDDLIIFSIHWGDNWDYRIQSEEIEFARSLIDEAGVDIFHGHSSHHVKGIEVYKNKLMLYGCGDFLTDYEGISGHEEFRGDLGLMYFASIDLNGNLLSLEMIPVKMHKFRITRPSETDQKWLIKVLNREGERFGTYAERVKEDDTLWLKWT